MLDLPPPIFQLLELIKAGANPDYPPRLKNVAHDVLLSTARTQRLIPLLAALLHNQRIDLPPDVAERVESETTGQTAAAMVQENALLEMTAAMERGNLQFLLIKGAALAHTIYPDLYWRPYADLDVLIKPERFEAVAATLGTLGLKVAAHMNLPQRLKYFNAVEFRHADNPFFQVDLHWNDVSASWSDRSVLTGEQVWANKREFEIGGRHIYTLSVPHTFIHLCVHWGYHHQFRTLISLLDLMLMLRRSEELVPETVFPIARACSCSRVVALSMAVIQSITGEDMEPWIDRHILPPTQQQRLLRMVEGHFRRGGLWRGRRLKALCLDSAQSRRRALGSFLAAKAGM